jgi:hypothetical protein
MHHKLYLPCSHLALLKQDTASTNGREKLGLALISKMGSRRVRLVPKQETGLDKSEGRRQSISLTLQKIPIRWN